MMYIYYKFNEYLPLFLSNLQNSLSSWVVLKKGVSINSEGDYTYTYFRNICLNLLQLPLCPQLHSPSVSIETNVHENK